MLCWFPYCWAGERAIQLEAHGKVDARFLSVRDVFLDCFAEGRETGAALTVVLDDEPVIDLWAGHRDRRRTQPWEESTLCCFFSVSKALTAACVLQAVSRGELDLDAPVHGYWPEFSGAEKAPITLRHLLNHQAGLMAFHDPLAPDELYDWSAVTERLAAEVPWFVPGTRHGYHARTFGFLLGEALRRGTGRGVGQWLREEFAHPLGADVHIGLAPGDIDRCATMLPARMKAGELGGGSAQQSALLAAMADPSTLTSMTFQNPRLGAGYMNKEAFRLAEMPAMNGHGTARGVARVLAEIPRALSQNVLTEAITTQSEGPDAVLLAKTRFGLGFMLYDPETPIGWPGCFGHAGAGGSVAFFDPERRLAFCYLMNQMENGVISGGVSATALSDAVFACL